MGVLVPPGEYQVRLTVDGMAQTARTIVQPDPRLTATDADYRAQFGLARQLRDATSAANEAVLKIRRMKAELAGATATAPADLLERLSRIEASLYQVKNQSPKDKIANPIKLNDRLAGLLAIVQFGDAAPSDAQRAVARELIAELDGQLAQLAGLTPK